MEQAKRNGVFFIAILLAKFIFGAQLFQFARSVEIWTTLTGQ